MSVITPEMKVGEISRAWPQTMRVFARYRLDLCCGGVHPLAYVAEKHGFSLEKMLEELNAEIATVPSPMG
ncbi:MAG: DUF542 domain-containing protein [Acidobacteriia bacterium]|nr:DUF542 domain-containing protein [Terriglobia bacterium]